MTHPYSNTEHVRYAPVEAARLVLGKNGCSCGAKHEFITSEIINSSPYGSTAEKCTCTLCGRVWEMAYTICQAMCVIKEAK